MPCFWLKQFPLTECIFMLNLSPVWGLKYFKFHQRISWVNSYSINLLFEVNFQVNESVTVYFNVYKTLVQCFVSAVAMTSATITGTREAKAGETLTLTCTTSNSNPAAIVTWIPQGSGGANIRSRSEASPDGGYITISEIDITLSSSQTTAIYTCSATNTDLGVTVSDTATVGILCK